MRYKLIIDISSRYELTVEAESTQEAVRKGYALDADQVEASGYCTSIDVDYVKVDGEN